MAVTATPSLMTMYAEAAPSFQASSFSGLPMSDAGPLTLGSSSFFNYTDNSVSFGGPWDSLFATTAGSSIFNLLPSPSLSFSDSSVYSTTDESDLQPLMSSDSEEFLPPINNAPVSSCSPTMHPNLVNTLKMVVGPQGPAGSSILQMYNSVSQASLLDSSSHLEPHQHDQSQQSDSIFRSAFLRNFHDSVVVPKVELQELTSTVGSVIPSHPKADDEAGKAVEKTESDEDNIEAAVVSVDLIKNKRPFKCQHEGCNKTFKNPQTMKMHHKTHYSDGSAASKECALPSSLKAGHNKKIPSRCPKCKETFVGLYELRRHYGRKHSEGEKPYGCRKCEKKFYIEVDVRDHEKLCGQPIECKCGLKFAFKCNLVAHKKAHPECQDHQTSQSNTSNTQSHSCSEDSEQGSQRSQRSGSKRAREDSSSPGPQSGLPIPLPDFKGIPEAPPEFKLARHDTFPSLTFPAELPHTTSWASNMVYPTIPPISFANLPYSKLATFQDRLQHFPPSHFISKLHNQQHHHQQQQQHHHHHQPQLQPHYSSLPSFEAVNCVMGSTAAFSNQHHLLPFKARSG